MRLGLCALLVGLLAALVVPASAAAVPIPPGLGELLVPPYVGAPAQPRPVDAPPVPQHPFLAENGRNSMHNDAYASDSYAGPGPLGVRPSVRSATYGIEECATLAFDRAGRIVGLCVNLVGPVLRRIDPDTLAVQATHRLPPRQVDGANPLENLCGGAYFYLDADDRAVVGTTERTIQVVGPSFTLERTYDLTAAVPADDCVVALMPDWDGRIWFETGGGLVGAVDPSTGTVRTHRLPGERIANSFAVDETGGVYIVSDHALYRFEATPDGTPEATWRQPYDRGSARKPGQLSQGSGTTPTLFGDGLVGITDNADPRMNVLVYRRSSGAKVCGTPVFEPGASATENSLTAVGSVLVVENNYGYSGPQSTLLGASTAPGIAKVDVDGGSCRTAWTSSEVAPSSVPKVSLQNGLLYVYTKPPHPLGVDAWYFTAIDVHTGRTAYSRRTGAGVAWNNHYAEIALGPDGTAYIPTLGGMVRVRDAAG